MKKENPSPGLKNVIFTTRGEAKVLVLEFDTEDNATVAYNIMNTWGAIRTFILDDEKPIFMFKATINSKSQYEVIPNLGKQIISDLKSELMEGEPFILATMSMQNYRKIDKILTCLFYQIVS